MLDALNLVVFCRLVCFERLIGEFLAASLFLLRFSRRKDHIDVN